MALKATIFRAEVAVADMDRNYYATHRVQLARHPSETSERMMVRLLAFVLHADEHLEFGKGLSADAEPDLWLRDLTGAVESWIEVGQPDERRLRQACGRAREVQVYAYGGQSVDLWWAQQRAALDSLPRLAVTRLDPEAVARLGELAERNMQLQATVQDGLAWLSDGSRAVEVEPQRLKALL